MQKQNVNIESREKVVKGSLFYETNTLMKLFNEWNYRCQRLRKECRPSEILRRRKAKIKSVQNSARLEEKLDSLVCLLQNPSSITTQRSPFLVNQQNFMKYTLSTPPIQLPELRDSVSGYNAVDPSTSRSSPESTVSYGHNAYFGKSKFKTDTSVVSQEDAREALAYFRDQKLKHFACIDLPKTATPQQLQASRPFLWFCILAIGLRNTPLQQAFGREVKELLIKRLLMKEEASLDLLQGTLIYLGWAHTHLHHASRLSVVAQLAISIIFELGLNKPLSCSKLVMRTLNSHGAPMYGPSNPAPRTIEERRAVISVFFITSVISSYFQRIDALRWTPYMDECLRILETENDLPTDIILVHQVKLQLICERLSEINSMQDHELSLSASLPYFLKTSQAQLENFKKNIPESLRDNYILLGQVHNAALIINELALSLPISLTSSSLSEFHHIEALYTCLYSVKSWLDLFFATPLSEYAGCPVHSHMGLSMAIFSQLTHCITVTYRLSTYEHPSWDKIGARDTVSLSNVVDQISAKFSQIKDAEGLNDAFPEDDAFARAIIKLGGIKSWWVSKLAAETSEGGLFCQAGAGAGVADEQVFAGFEFTDGSWLRDIMSDWDFQPDQIY
ncbi:hypothetical protein BGZ60DRAFT_529418 [Tricladium varicosporioides]|nr:hypothetical protein BGZ60DRAFT_529418 [Hymenoscyphus varicosporioides]